MRPIYPAEPEEEFAESAAYNSDSICVVALRGINATVAEQRTTVPPLLSARRDARSSSSYGQRCPSAFRFEVTLQLVGARNPSSQARRGAIAFIDFEGRERPGVADVVQGLVNQILI